MAFITDDSPKLWPPLLYAVIANIAGRIAGCAHVWNKVDQLFLEQRGKIWTPDLAPELAALGFEAGARWIVEKFDLDEDPRDICKEWDATARRLYSTEVHLKPGVLRYISHLKAMGVPVALATSNGVDVVKSLRPEIDVWDIFDAQVFGSEIGKSKKHPDIYLEAARRLEVDPKKCIVFEDIAPALHGAQTAGMITVAVKSDDPTQDFSLVKGLADLYLLNWKNINYGDPHRTYI